MLKIYVDENNLATFICPYCGFEKRFNALPFKNKKKNINIKCKCGKPSALDIEFRRSIRKVVNLTGICTMPKTKQKCTVIIKNLSLQGIGIEFLIGDKKYVKALQVGTIIHIAFNLDDKRETHIARSCVIRTIMNLNIGAEFNDENYAKQLGFYLMG